LDLIFLFCFADSAAYSVAAKHNNEQEKNKHRVVAASAAYIVAAATLHKHTKNQNPDDAVSSKIHK